ncbi:hypothetical protein [Insolitispirillum peregrinum]|uniref:hypothetical protein n=1 Tax=Insolitispirillum peregrinum TaxID=80876 RepID=UPI0036D30928
MATVVAVEMIAAVPIFLLVCREALSIASAGALLFLALRAFLGILILSALVAKFFAFLYWFPLTALFAQKGITDAHSFGKAGLVPGCLLIVLILVMDGGFDTPDGLYSYAVYAMLFGSFLLAGYLGGRAYVKAMNGPPRESWIKDFSVKES